MVHIRKFHSEIYENYGHSISWLVRTNIILAKYQTFFYECDHVMDLVGIFISIRCKLKVETFVLQE